MSLINELNLEDESFTFDLKITSMTQHANGTQVNATGKAGRYGKVWLTYEFTPNPKQEHTGSFIGIGRAVSDEGVANEGQRRGVYVGDGLRGTVYSFDDVTDGAPNFCIEKWDLTNETIQMTFSRIAK